MTTENHQQDPSNLSSTSSLINGGDSSSKMLGWLKLWEKIRKSNPPSNVPTRLLPNSNSNTTTNKQKTSFSNSSHTNGHILTSSETINKTLPSDSARNTFDCPSIISIHSTPEQIIGDLSFVNTELVPTPRTEKESAMEPTPTTVSSSSPASNVSEQSPKHSKKITIRKSTKAKETPIQASPLTTTKSTTVSTPITEDISDDDFPLVDIRRLKTKSIETLSIPTTIDSIIPLGTDLQPLPDHTQEDLRDTRFINYTDIDNLSNHLNTCLIIDKTSYPSSKPHIFKTRHNVLHKILKIYYIKTFRPNVVLGKKSCFQKKDYQKQQPLSVISSPTSTSFKTDWNVNRRHPTSTHRHTPKNSFHILQQNPKTNFSFLVNSSSTSTSQSPVQTFERIKDVLARTYYPHLHTAIEYGYQFGAKSIIPNTRQLVSTRNDLVPIKEPPVSPCSINDSVIISLQSPPSTSQQNSIPLEKSPMTRKRYRQNETDPRSSISTERSLTEDLEETSPLLIKKSIVVLTPADIPIPSPPIIDKAKKLITNRKRRSSPVTNTNVVERKKTKILSSSPLPEIINQYEDISTPESEEEMLPSQLPKQSFIKNGLRSNYYKTPPDSETRSTSSRTRRRRQSSGSLPSFYTGLFESDDDKSSHIDYCLPYDIYWHGQQKTVNNSSSAISISPSLRKKKKSSQPKQKQPLPFKKIFRNVYTDQIKQNLLSSYSAEKAPVCDCKPPSACDDGVCLNKFSYTECSPKCACGAKCSNQRIRKNQWSKHIEVFDTSKYGQGLRATATIPKGTFLCEYVGEIITEEKFHERMTNLYSKDEHHYTMKLTQNLVIDAYRTGSIARFANHSCSPNCEFQKWIVDGLQRMCMFSLKTIKPGDELTYDYNFQCFNLEAQQPCYCESSKCRGTIGSKQQTTTSQSITTTTTTNNNNNTNHNHQIGNIQRLTQREKRMISRSSIFLLRNLRRIKEKQELSNKNKNNQLKQPNDKQSGMSLFFASNYYHSNRSNQKSTLASLRKAPKLAHKDLFYLFYNHIRRSHFVKSGRYQTELIDESCYYAQLAQLTVILNEIFESILHYRCADEDIIPSIVLQKCPSKRLVPAYYEIIDKPIDLIMIKNKLDNAEYLSFDLFEEDLALLFTNAIIFCGKDSDEARVVSELRDYFFQTLKIEYQPKFELFDYMNENERKVTNLHTLENFIGRLHEREVLDGQVRKVLYDLIYDIDEDSPDNSPIVYKIVLGNSMNSHRTGRTRTSSDCIVHCRCGSVYDENSLVQCYACQLWQHVACVSIADPSQPYYCFECQPECEQDPSSCLKTNVLINANLAPLQTYDDNYCSFSTLTRTDGFVIRINECYFVPKQDKKNIDRSLTSPEYDILCVERLWIDDDGVGQASGFYYIRPNETFHEPTRKFFPNEVFRFPASNDPLPISSFVRPCFVLDMKTYTKGKPIGDNSSRVLSSDIFICEYRVDKTARTFTRLNKSRQFGINTKSYCFDNYVEKPSIKRDYQPYQKEVQQQQHHHHDNRRRSTGNSSKLNNKQLKEKITRMNGLIEKIYCRLHDQNSIPNGSEHTTDQFLHRSTQSSISITKKSSLPCRTPAGNISKKRRTISLSSDDDIVELLPENDCRKPSKKRSTNHSSRKRDEFIDQILPLVMINERTILTDTKLRVFFFLFLLIFYNDVNMYISMMSFLVCVCFKYS